MWQQTLILAKIMKKNYHKWTDVEDKVVIGLYEDGCAIKDIAEAVGLTKSAITNRVHVLKKNGLITVNHNFIWDEQKEKELVKILQKNEGNLRNGFREFADKYNIGDKAVSNKYYAKDRKSLRIKDKYPIFSVFGRYRGIANSKIYTRGESKGHTMWTAIKEFFKF